MRIPLNGKAYQERSVIASAQETINLYGELNTADSGAPVPITYYPTPGQILFGQPPAINAAKTRCTYRTSIGTAYTVIGPQVYFVSTNGALTLIGIIGDNPSQVYMADNGLVAVLVDGTSNGYAIELATNNFAPIVDPSFYGADFVTYLLTFFVFNRPKTNQFYISLSQVNFGMLAGTAISTGTIVGGNGYVVGVYQSVPLTGGSGQGATADITVVDGGAGNGNIVGGSLYTNGVYPNVPLTGGLGSGAIATITVAGGVITVVDFTGFGNGRGQAYAVADVLTAPNNLIGGTGSGFTYTLTSVVNGTVTDVEIDDPGEGYLISDVLSADAANLGGSGAGFTFTIVTTALAFDPLDIAAKSGSADPIVAILAVHEELWLIGALTTEVWVGTGAADFFFQQVQGAYIEHGCIAQYTAASTDVLAFWLQQDRQGKCLVIQGSGYDVDEISTPYLVDQFDNYAVVSDAIGFCFQISGHAFYCLIFPTQNITWLYELKTKQWNKWLWTNVNDGSLNRNRANCAMFFNNKNIVGDWENGNLYKLDAETYTDAGVPIIRIKTFIHMLDDLDRVYYRNFDLDIETGTQSPDVQTEPIVTLSWSDDRGKSYGYPVEQTLGQGGQFKTTVTWNRLGYARDRVFRMQTSEPIQLALNGGFCEVAKGRT